MKKLITTLFIIMMISSCGTDVKNKAHRNAVSSMHIGHAYLLQGNYTTALKDLLNAEKTITDNPYLENDLGLVLMAKKRSDLAEKHFKKAVELKPDYIPAKNNLGTSYLKQKKWNQAIAVFKSISSNLLYATPHYPLSNMGWAYIGKKEYRSAEKEFSLALKMQPDFIQAIHGLATVFLKTGRDYSAVNFLNKKIKKNPSAVILYDDLAKAYEITQEFSKAKKTWQNIIKLAPESSLATEAKAHIRRLITIP